MHDFFRSWIIFLISTCPISVGTKNRIWEGSGVFEVRSPHTRHMSEKDYQYKRFLLIFFKRLHLFHKNILQSSYEGRKPCFRSIEKPSNEKRHFADDAASAGANLKMFFPVGKKLKRRSNINVKCGFSGFLSRLPCLRKQ